MCGICGIASADGHADVEALRAMCAAARPPRPRRRRRRTSTATSALGCTPPLDHRPRRRATSRWRTRTARVVVFKRRDLQLPRAARRARGARATRSATAVRHRGARPSLRGARRRLRGAAARHVRLRDLGRARRRLVLARDRFGIKPLYYRDDGGALALRVRAARRLAARRDRPRRARGVPRLQLDPRAAHDLPRRPQAASRARAGLGGRLGPTIERYWAARPVAADELRDDDEAELRGAAARGCATRCRRISSRDVPLGVLLSGGVDSARARRAAAQETPEPVHTFSIGFDEPSFDERDDARRVAERFGTDHHELLVTPRRRAAPAARSPRFDEPFADSSAIPTYLVSQLARRARQGRALGRRRRRALRRLHTYAADLLADRVAPVARFARPLVEALPSSSRKASFDYRRSASSAPRICRRSSGTTAGRRSSRRTRDASCAAARPLDPVDVYRAPLRRDRRRARARAPAGRRLRRIPVDDLLMKTDRASMAHSLEVRVPFLDPLVDEPRLRATDATQGSRAPEEGPAAQGGRAAAAARDHPREEAWFLDPGGGVAARRARAVRARDALGRDAAAPGLLRAGARDAAPRRARRRPGGLEPAALGPARVHALVRTARRAGAAASAVRPDGDAGA